MTSPSSRYAAMCLEKEAKEKRLRDAAPALLEALQDATDYVKAQAHRHKDDSTFQPFVASLEAAIAQATSE